MVKSSVAGNPALVLACLSWACGMAGLQCSKSAVWAKNPFIVFSPLAILNTNDVPQKND